MPSNAQLLAALSPAMPEAEIVARRPYRYATSHALEELSIRHGDGAERALILKHLAPRPECKPEFLYEPERERVTLREILAPAAIGPQLVADGHGWLLLEHVAGVELWQVGDFSIWEAVASWLASFHARFAGQTDALAAASPLLLIHDAAWYALWRDRALARLRDSRDPRADELIDALGRYDASALAALPPTLLHGELYPSNVIVDPARVVPVDWEMAAIGPGLIDLAALVGGWDATSRGRLLAAYGASEGHLLTCARLQLALQWLGWSEGWSPPSEHAHDWTGEALSLVRELGL